MSKVESFLPSNRLAAFKHHGKNSDEMRRRRMDTSIELRKANRFQEILKKRNIDENQAAEETSASTHPVMTISEIMIAIKSNDSSTVFMALQDVRRILSKDRNPPIEEMISSGIVPYLVEFLSLNYSDNFQFEACWAITNIASGDSDDTSSIIQAGALPKLIKLLESPNKNVAEQAAWALGNIAGDGPKYRDQILGLNALPSFLKLLESDHISVVRTVVWAISNLCRNRNPAPPFDIVSTCLPALRKLLHSNDNLILSDTCWSLSYLTDGPDSRIQATIDAGVVPRLVELLSISFNAGNFQVLSPALRTLGNIVTGNDVQTDCVIRAGALPKLRALLEASSLNIVKEAAWSISNITAGNSDQIQAVIDADILPSLIIVLESGDFKSQREAAWAITNFTFSATVEQLSYLLRLGILNPLCNLVNSKDWKTILVVLDALFNILLNAEKVGEIDQIRLIIEECGGLDKIQYLQNHENEQIYQKALNLIDKFFSSEDDDVNITTEEMNGQFNFKPMEPTGQFNF